MTPGEQDLIYDTGPAAQHLETPNQRGRSPGSSPLSASAPDSPKSPGMVSGSFYQVGRGDSSEVAVMDINGGQQEILTPESGKRFSHSFASDNRRIAYAGFEKGVWNLYWIDRITHERKQITQHTAYGSFVRSPAWRPGTEQMAYEYSEVKGNIETAAAGTVA